MKFMKSEVWFICKGISLLLQFCDSCMDDGKLTEVSFRANEIQGEN